ncbi:capsular polysaccharide biosynthesis chain length regulator [Listeria floridensis FSL S10-1187]|uniref:Capsular polysaccharide biosynthesis chain length regulator n=1 Tax=Listeria floridensis FSL S10-1187 TaxID=1265817 RepID=A0ABP3AUI3_9LIST|nr:Wzz/FepE/Etk N-terminal domain-containing protein [Listeria floridensis]EUJ26125.1 capsular polysaccharide biosynthesis chain length regulator [Listeria floridensis FSL S10-1187]
MEEVISLSKLISGVKKNKWVILFSTTAAVCIMVIYLFWFATPIYKGGAQILVNQSERETSLEAQSVQANLQLVNTYKTIILSPRILGEVKAKLGNRYTLQGLSDSVEVDTNADSQVITITAQDADPKQAVLIANQTAEVFKKQIPNIMKINNVTILSYAKTMPNQAPIKPKKMILLIASFFLGLIIGFIIMIIRLIFDRSIKDAEDIQNCLDIPLLGVVSEMNMKGEVKNGKKN